MAGTFKTLQDKIVAKLEAIPSIADVQPTPDPKFTGFPAANVYPSDQDSDYEDTASNERVYVFIIALYYEHQKTNTGKALTALYDLTDEVLDAFDTDPLLAGLSLPTGKQLITVQPTTSEWGETEDRQLLTTQITVQIRVSVDVPTAC